MPCLQSYCHGGMWGMCFQKCHVRHCSSCTLQAEYVSLACSAGEWASAVRKLVALGGRRNIARATALTVDVIQSPAAKVRGGGLAHVFRRFRDSLSACFGPVALLPCAFRMHPVAYPSPRPFLNL